MHLFYSNYYLLRSVDHWRDDFESGRRDRRLQGPLRLRPHDRRVLSQLKDHSTGFINFVLRLTNNFTWLQKLAEMKMTFYCSTCLNLIHKSMLLKIRDLIPTFFEITTVVQSHRRLEDVLGRDVFYPSPEEHRRLGQALRQLAGKFPPLRSRRRKLRPCCHSTR